MGKIVSIKYEGLEIELDDELIRKIEAILLDSRGMFDSPLQVKNS